jgi:hypothetical protein
VAEVIGRTKAAFDDDRTPPSGETDSTEVKSGGRYDLRKRENTRSIA